MSEHPWNRAARRAFRETLAYATATAFVLATALTTPWPSPLGQMLRELALAGPALMRAGVLS